MCNVIVIICITRYQFCIDEGVAKGIICRAVATAMAYFLYRN